MSQAVFLKTELRHTVRANKKNQFSFGILSLSKIIYPFKKYLRVTMYPGIKDAASEPDRHA